MMNKIAAVIASANTTSSSRLIIERMKENLNEVIDLSEEPYISLGCEGCFTCADDKGCFNISNEILKNTLLKQDMIVLFAPIYYGALSSKCKSFLEACYSYTHGELKGKKMIVILNASKHGQSGIAIQELLAWSYKHQVQLVDIIEIDGQEQSHPDKQVEMISQSIGKFSTSECLATIEFTHVDYINQKFGIPCKYSIEVKNDK